MTGMETVLAAHRPIYRWSPVYEDNVWACSTGMCDVLGSLENAISHQAAELTEAGYGSQHDAWKLGHRTPVQRKPSGCRCGAWGENECACGKYGTGKIITPNPYPGAAS